VSEISLQIIYIRD